MFVSSFIAGIFAAVVGAPAGAGAETELPVEIWRDRSVELAAVEAFDWVEPPALGEWSRRQKGQLTLEDRIRDLLQAELERVGIERRIGDGADVLVGFELVAPRSAANRRQPPRIQRCGRIETSAQLILGAKSDDRFLVVLFDPASGLPVWRGRVDSLLERSWGSKALRRGEERNLDDTLQAAASAILGQIPRTQASALSDG